MAGYGYLGALSNAGGMAKRAIATNPAAALAGFIGKFAPEHQRLIRNVRTALRRRLPTANELVYDNYNFFVIGYSPTERPSDTIVSLAAGANRVGRRCIEARRCRIRIAACSDQARRTGSFGCPPRRCCKSPISKRSSRRRSRNPEYRWQQPMAVAASW